MLSAALQSRFTTHPLDTIKTHMMIDRSGGGAGSQSIWAVGRGIVRSEGVRGLYSGVTLAMVCASFCWHGVVHALASIPSPMDRVGNLSYWIALAPIGNNQVKSIR